MKARNIFAAATMALASLAAHADLYGTCVLKYTSPLVEGVMTDVKVVPYGQRSTILLRINAAGEASLKEGEFPSMVFVTLVGAKGERAFPLIEAVQGQGMMIGSYAIPGTDSTLLVAINGEGGLTTIFTTANQSLGGSCEGAKVKEI